MHNRQYFINNNVYLTLLKAASQFVLTGYNSPWPCIDNIKLY